MTVAIHTRALHKRYGSHTALHGLDLTVQSGSVFGLIGPNFNAIAMEPLGHIAGAASAMLGFVTTSGGAALGYLVSSRFDGSVLPLTLGFACFALSGLAVVAWTERGRMFRV